MRKFGNSFLKAMYEIGKFLDSDDEEESAMRMGMKPRMQSQHCVIPIDPPLIPPIAINPPRIPTTQAIEFMTPMQQIIYLKFLLREIFIYKNSRLTIEDVVKFLKPLPSNVAKTMLSGVFESIVLEHKQTFYDEENLNLLGIHETRVRKEIEDEYENAVKTLRYTPEALRLTGWVIPDRATTKSVDWDEIPDSHTLR